MNNNGDRIYTYAVIRTDLGLGTMLCNTDGGQPAVYADSPPAEVFAQTLRQRYPDCTFKVLQFVVL